MMCNKLILLIVLLMICASFARPSPDNNSKTRGKKVGNKRGESNDESGKASANLHRSVNPSEGKGNVRSRKVNNKPDNSQIKNNGPLPNMNDMSQKKVSPNGAIAGKIPQPMGQPSVVSNDKMQQGSVPMGASNNDAMSKDKNGKDDKARVIPSMPNSNSQMQPSSNSVSKSGPGDVLGARPAMDSPHMNKESDKMRQDGSKPLFVKGDMPLLSNQNVGLKTDVVSMSKLPVGGNLPVKPEMSQPTPNFRGRSGPPEEGSVMKPIMDVPASMMKESEKKKLEGDNSAMKGSLSSIQSQKTAPNMPNMPPRPVDAKSSLDGVDKIKPEMDKTGAPRMLEESVKGLDMKKPPMPGSIEHPKIPNTVHTAVNIPKEEAHKAMIMAKPTENGAKSPEETKKLAMPAAKIPEKFNKPADDDDDDDE